MHPVIEWKNNKVYILDQRLLPEKVEFKAHSSYTEVAESIRDMVIRGAPAIGVAAAMGVALGIVNGKIINDVEFKKIVNTLSATRPTAINLFWALERMKKVYLNFKSNKNLLKRKIVEEALNIEREDIEINRLIGHYGQQLLRNGQTILTHCNAGELATAGYGTALGVVRSAVELGKKISVIACETRPYLQGARLTVWELQRDGIPVTLITDNAAGYLMSKRMIHSVVVGADRITKNGDTANKIGTYSLAVMAGYHNIPFYVAAPISTIDFSLKSGKDIPIEEREKNEIIYFRKQLIARPDTEVFNPAFDITPHQLITAIITEKGVILPDFKKNIDKIAQGSNF